MHTTYGIVDPVTRLFVYVGRTADFEARKRQHLTTHRQKKTHHKDGSLQAWLIQAHAAKITPAFIVLDVVETEALSLDSENNWIEKLAAIGHPLLNRWDEHKELIEAGRPPPADRFDAFHPGQWRSSVAEMEPTSRKKGYNLTFKKKVSFEEGDRLIVLNPSNKK